MGRKGNILVELLACSIILLILVAVLFGHTSKHIPSCNAVVEVICVFGWRTVIDANGTVFREVDLNGQSIPCNSSMN